MNTVPLEELLEHSGWLHALAQRLVRDSAAAEDLVQETWMAALRRPPSGENPRGWLRRVVTRLAHNRHRSTTAREDREVCWSRSAPPSTPEEVALETEAQRSVAAAVAGLDEPHRTLVLLRYYRGLDSREIGRLQGVPPATVRSRLTRALAELRLHLDREHGDRRNWAAMLVPLLEVNGPSPPAFGVAGALAIVVLLPALVLTGLWIVREDRPAAHARDEAAVSASRSRPSEPGRIPGEVAVVERRAPAREPATISRSAGMASEIRGRILNTDGSPLVGHSLELRGVTAGMERVLQFGLPEDWTNPTTVTDEDGRFVFTFDAPPAYQFFLSLHVPGHVKETWRWSGLQGEDPRADLGDICMRRGGSVRGRILRPDGSPLLHVAWKIYADEKNTAVPRGPRSPSRHQTVSDPETGTFLLEHLPPGTVELRAHTDTGAHLLPVTVQVATDEETTQEFVYDGPDPTRRVGLFARIEGYPGIPGPRPQNIHLLGAADSPLHPEVLSRESFVFDDLDPGAYSIVIDDPRFEAWAADNVQSGTRAKASLRGSGSVALSVTGPAGLLTDYTVHLELLEATFRPNTWLVHDGAAPLPGGRLSGIVPGSYRLRLEAEEHGSSEVLLTDLAPGEVRPLEIELTAPPSVRGRVLFSDGTPAAGTLLRLLRVAPQQDGPDSPVIDGAQGLLDPNLARRPLRKALAGTDGSFSFDPGFETAVALQAERNVSLRTSTAGFDPRDAAEFELVLPAIASLEGRLLGPPGTDFDGLRFQAVPEHLNGEAWRSATDLSNLTRYLDAEGGFAYDELPSGPHELFLLLPDTPAGGPWGPSTSFRGSTVRRSLGSATLAAGANSIELDAAALLPGRVQVHVSSNGEPLGGVHVSFQEPGGVHAPVPTGPDGRAPLITDFPGPRRLRASGAVGWVHLHDEVVEILSDETSTVHVDLDMASGSLRVLDQEERPLVGAVLQLVPAPGSDAFFEGQALVTDEQGRVQLRLPVGPHDLLLRDPVAPDEEDPWELLWALPRVTPDTPRRTISWSDTGATVRF